MSKALEKAINYLRDYQTTTNSNCSIGNDDKNEVCGGIEDVILELQETMKPKTCEG